MKKLSILGLVVTAGLMLFAVPYAIHAYFDTSIPFDPILFVIAGISVLLFGINLYYYKYR